jgi:hypothetical protein
MMREDELSILSFGTAAMSENMANLYRLGYWLMAVDILVTFA